MTSARGELSAGSSDEDATQGSMPAVSHTTSGLGRRSTAAVVLAARLVGGDREEADGEGEEKEEEED